MLNSNGLMIRDKARRRVQFTVQARRSHVNAFELGTQTMTAYCKQHRIPISTFSAWVTKYGKNQRSGFSPVQLQSEAPPQPTPNRQKASQLHPIEINRGDLKIILPVISDVRTAIEIIKGVLACN